MAKKAYIGVNGTARKVKKIYVGIENIARKVKKGYVGVNGTARLFLSASELKYNERLANLSTRRGSVSGAVIGDYVIFGGGKSGSGMYEINTDCYNKSMSKISCPNMYYAAERYAAAENGMYAIFAGGGTKYRYDYSDDEIFNYAISFSSSLTRAVNKRLSVGRAGLSGARAGNYALFAGGDQVLSMSTSKDDDTGQSKVDSFNQSLTITSPASLGRSRTDLTGASFNGYAFFAGGRIGRPFGNGYVFYNNIDIYSPSLTRTVNHLTYTASDLAGAANSAYLIFCGGRYYETGSSDMRSEACAFNKSLTRVNAPSLSVPKRWHSGAGLSDYAIFAGGERNGQRVSNIVDVYDTSLTRTTITNLKQARRVIGSAVLENYAIFAGGDTYGYYTNQSNGSVYVDSYVQS